MKEDNNINFEKRLERIANINTQIDSVFEKIPEKFTINGKEISVSKNTLQKVKNLIAENKDIKELSEAIQNRRPPRLILIGRTGAGKSALINALLGSYVAKTSAVKIGTGTAEKYQYEKNGTVLLEIIDTRGIGESDPNVKENTESEKEIINDLKEFNPDALIFVSKATVRDRLHDDIKELKKYIKIANKINDTNLPFVTVLTNVDGLEPIHQLNPQNYSEKKLNLIEDKKREMKQLLDNNDISSTLIIPVSSYIHWDEEYPEDLSPDQQQKMGIEFDGRYNIEILKDFLENNMELKAVYHFFLYTEYGRVIKSVSNKVTNGFAMVSSAIALNIIPLADVFILIPMQITLIMIIAFINGVDLTFEESKKLLLAMGATGAAGYLLRIVFQQAVKYVPGGAGLPLSSTIAAGGTYMIGRSARAYFAEGQSIESATAVGDKESKDQNYEDDL